MALQPNMTFLETLVQIGVHVCEQFEKADLVCKGATYDANLQTCFFSIVQKWTGYRYLYKINVDLERDDEQTIYLTLYKRVYQNSLVAPHQRPF